MGDEREGDPKSCLDRKSKKPEKALASNSILCMVGSALTFSQLIKRRGLKSPSSICGDEISGISHIWGHVYSSSLLNPFGYFQTAP